MPSLILECPHCGAEKIGFTVLYQAQATINPQNVVKRFRVYMSCSNCEEAVIGIFDKPAASPNPQDPTSCPIDPRMMGWRLTKIYPTPKPSQSPDYTPDYLKKIFLQAANALRRGDPDASGAMSRKVVDVSTQQLLGEESKNYHNIQGRIDALATANRLTPDLKDWAHQVRLGGNDAAHNIDPFTPEEADELLNFAELYLTYVYALPGRLKERRERAEKEKSATAKGN
jgi:hypothetical protein